MTRIEQRACDRCGRQDDLSDHGWASLDIQQSDYDLCRGCSKDLVLWMAAGVPGGVVKGPAIVGLEA